jgi:hypothetical protein
MSNIGSGLLEDFAAYMMPFDAIEDYDAIRIPRNRYEIGSIPCRREWRRDVSSSVMVSNTKLFSYRSFRKGRKSTKKYGVLHAGQKVITRTSVHRFNSIWIEEL